MGRSALGLGRLGEEVDGLGDLVAMGDQQHHVACTHHGIAARHPHLAVRAGDASYHRASRKQRVGAHRSGPHHGQAERGRDAGRLGVEVELHLHVIGHETDRHHDHRHADKDERLNKAEYTQFKARERLRGFWIDEVNHEVEYRDARGKLVNSSRTATVREGDETPDTDGMKLGSSWTYREASGMVNGNPRWRSVRSEIVFLNGEWSKTANADDRKGLYARNKVYFSDGKLWRRLNMYLSRSTLVESTPGTHYSGSSSGNRANTESYEALELQEIELPAGKLSCYVAEDARGGKHYTHIIGGIRINAATVNAAGVRTLELLSIDK